MDRISALRNIEDALRSFEAGEADLETTERHVVNVIRTYATDFEGDDDSLAAYRARGDDRADGLVVLADSPEQAETRIRELLGEDDAFTGAFEVDRLS